MANGKAHSVAFRPERLLCLRWGRACGYGLAAVLWAMPGVWACAVALPVQGAAEAALPVDEAAGSDFKDRVLAICIQYAYRHEVVAADDAGRAAAFLDRASPPETDPTRREIDWLVDQYLQRDYFEPFSAWQHRGLRFDLLKCIDLYHGRPLDDLTVRLLFDQGHGDKKSTSHG